MKNKKFIVTCHLCAFVYIFALFPDGIPTSNQQKSIVGDVIVLHEIRLCMLVTAADTQHKSQRLRMVENVKVY